MSQVAIPDVHSFEQIVERARQKAAARGRRCRVAVVAASDEKTLCALANANQTCILDYCVIGDRQEFHNAARKIDLPMAPTAVYETPTATAAIGKAVAMAAAGEIDVIVQGRMVPAQMLTQLFHSTDAFLVKGQTVSHVGIFKPKKYPKLLMITDGAVVVQPDLPTKLNLIGNMIKVSNTIGIPNPRIGLLAAVEAVYLQMPVTTEAAIIAKMAERGQIKGAFVDGPLSLDCAVDMDAALGKGIRTSQVAGQADGLVAPNLETAHGIYTALSLFGSEASAGVVIGGITPVVISAAVDSIETRYHSLLTASLFV